MPSSIDRAASRIVADRTDRTRGVGLSILIVALALGCSRQSAIANPASSVLQPPFWQIDAPETESQERAGRLYLLGSIHVGPVGGWPLPVSIMERFDASKALIVEVDMSERADPEAQDDLVLAHGLLPAGESLANHVSEGTYALLSRYAEKRGRSLANLNPWRAWMVATMLLTTELERLGYPTEAGVDLDLIARAKSLRPVIGLETMEGQLSLLSSMSPADQELMLKDMLLQMNAIESYFDELQEAWRTGNDAKLETVLFRELERTPELAPFYERVIYARNETMCEGLRKQLDSGETRFGVVGAYHLVGERGIPACLEKHGYRVTRLEYAATSK